jgi:hypothetical protein
MIASYSYETVTRSNFAYLRHSGRFIHSTCPHIIFTLIELLIKSFIVD